MEEEREVMKGISPDEQETVIQYNRNDDYMTIYTTDSTVMTKLDKCLESGNYEVIEEHKLQGSSRIIGKTYKAKKKFLSFRTANRVNKRVMTEEEKKAFVERAKLAREKKARESKS